MHLRELLKASRGDILRIAARHGAYDVRVFGSVARGQAGPQSDVDFLVRLKPGSTLLDHAAMVREIEALLGCKVDIVSEHGLRPQVRERVLQDAVPL